MKRIIAFSAALLIGLVLTSFTSEVKAQGTKKKPATEQQVAKKYTCPMHSQVLMDKPGKCPICGMALVEKKDMKQEGMQQKHKPAVMKSKNSMTMHDTTKMKKDK